MLIFKSLLAAAAIVTTIASPVAAQPTEPAAEPADERLLPIDASDTVLEWADDQNVVVEWTPYDETLPAIIGDDPGVTRLVSQTLPGPALMTGLTWSGASPVAVWLQQQTNGEWGVWEPLPIGHATDHAGDFEGGQETEGEVSRRGTDAIVLAEPDAFRYLVEGSIDEGWAFIFADQPTTLRPQAAPSSSTAEVYWPGASFVRDRSEWDTTDCRIPDAEFNYSSSQAVIVHHTASSNAYSQSQVPALLRGLCAFQTGSRELDDLGYNFMVDRFGTVWEGRTGSKRAPITSAHARGFNHNTQGVALLGNYDAATPPPAQLTGLQSILNWLTGLHGIDPDERVTLIAGSDGSGFVEGDRRIVNGVAGHREVGQTACPGGMFFPRLAAIAANTQPTDFATNPATASTTVGALRFGDFNGDGNTDVFSTFGGSWWYSSGGTSAWIPLNTSNAAFHELGFGDFDGDGTTDVFSTFGGQWRYSSGGTSAWTQLATSRTTVDQLRFGDFNGDGTTDVFSTFGGQWRYSSGGTSAWTQLATSRTTVDQLRFGDFNGDGTTDVFSTSGGQWHYSSGGTSAWVRLLA